MRHVYACLLLCSALSAFAQQDVPKAEVFGGYSYLHIDTEGVTGSTLDTDCNSLLGAGTCPPGSFGVHPSANGWNASAQLNATRFLGIKADFSGHYNTPVTISPQITNSLTQLGITGLPPKATSYSYLFGPVIFQSKGRYKPFAHALFGQNSIGTNLSNVKVGGIGIPGLTVSDTAFAMAFGGGVDVKLSGRIALRAGQVDYLYTKHDFSSGVPGVASHQNNLRASVGIVFQFGAAHQMETPQPQAHGAHATAAIPIRTLGVYVVQADSGGAQIAELSPHGAAALAGLHPGDIINTVNESKVKSPTELASVLSTIAPGSKVRIVFAIHGEWQSEATVTLGNP
jgi:opacity protein-like surface antigen